MRKRKVEAKKMILHPGIIKVEPNEKRGKASIILGQYPDKDMKGPYEERFASALIRYLRVRKNRDVEIVKCEAPDFICREGSQEFGLELYELVSASERKQRALQSYLELIKARLGKKTLFLQIDVKHGQDIYQTLNREGQRFVDELVQVINYSEGKDGLISGELCPWRVVGQVIGFMYHTDQGILGQIANAIYFSSTVPIGIAHVPDDSDYKEWETKLQEKWLKGYGVKCWLLIHTFGVRPDFERVIDIIKSLNIKHGVKFCQVWFLKKYPDVQDKALDDIRSLFDCGSNHKKDQIWLDKP